MYVATVQGSISIFSDTVEEHKKHAKLKGEECIFLLHLTFFAFLKVMSNEKNMGLENLQTSGYMFWDHRIGNFFTPTPVLSLRITYPSFLRHCPARKEVLVSTGIAFVFNCKCFTLVFKGSLLFKICKKLNKKNMKRMFQGEHASKIVIVALARDSYMCGYGHCMAIVE